MHLFSHHSSKVLQQQGFAAEPGTHTFMLQHFLSSFCSSTELQCVAAEPAISLIPRNSTRHNFIPPPTTTRSVAPHCLLVLADFQLQPSHISFAAAALCQGKQTDRCRAALNGRRGLPGVCTRCVVPCNERQQGAAHHPLCAGDGAAAVVLQLLLPVAVGSCHQHWLQTQGMQLHWACSLSCCVLGCAKEPSAAAVVVQLQGRHTHHTPQRRQQPSLAAHL
jgi:hypothetical protein